MKGKFFIRCLGFCGKKFWSTDKVNIRFCRKCKAKQNGLNISFRDLGRFNILEKTKKI